VNRPIPTDRVVFDTSALLGSYRGQLVAAAALRYCVGYWSSWIVAEFVRKRTEWIADRAAREGCNRVELRRRLREGRTRVNRLVDEMSYVLQSVDYAAAVATALDWLPDLDDRPVMLTALAAAADVLVTDNSADFPLGESRNGVLLLSTSDFLTKLYTTFQGADSDIEQFLQQAQ
jgi:hypothetical protein